MPTPDEQRRPPSGTVYGSPAMPRPGRDRLMTAALATGAAGVLIGVLLATGVFVGGGTGDQAAGLPGPTTPGSAAPTGPTSPGGAAAGNTDPAPPPQTPPPQTSPPQTPARTFRSVESSFCLAMSTGDPSGAEVRQVVCTGDPAQQWRPTPVVGDQVSLVNMAAGRCLEVADGSKDNGARLRAAVCNGSAEQQWRLAATGSGPVALVNLNSGRCADVPGDSRHTADTGLQQWGCHGGGNQQWTAG
jgi:hypothetical protein